MPRRRKSSRHSECALCLEKLQSPRMLPCVHTFCLKCLDDLIKSQARAGHFPCPVCRKSIPAPTEGAKGFPVNIFLVDDDEEGGDERDEEADEDHEETEPHGEDPNSRQTYDRCDNHQHRFLRFYCTRCKTSICRDCKLTSHEGHPTSDVTTEVKRVRKLVDDVRTASENVALPRMYQAIDDLASVKGDSVKRRKQVRQEIKQKGEHLKEVVDKCVKECLKSCDSAFKTAQKPIDDTLEKMRVALQELQTFTEQTAQKTKEGTSHQNILSLDQEIKDFFSDRDASSPATRPHSTVTNLQKTLSQDPFSLPKLKVFAESSHTIPRLELCATSAAEPAQRFAKEGAAGDDTALSAVKASVKSYIGEVREVSKKTSETRRQHRVNSHEQRPDDPENSRASGITSAAAFNQFPDYPVMPYEQ
ncbi:hypothetical protein BaRGS_00036322 [Batillaria attramentaria]|uniref:Tripartite motif-containing protein 3-like n=1 Tax=Batillaria attramentaria TaxID=370345 RepID=A0ABD0JCA1_9CAEN